MDLTPDEQPVVRRAVAAYKARKRYKGTFRGTTASEILEELKPSPLRWLALAAFVIETAEGPRKYPVPPLTENSARLLGTPSDRALLNTPIADALFVQENNGESLAWGWIVFIPAVVVAGVAVGIYYLAKAILEDLGERAN